MLKRGKSRWEDVKGIELQKTRAPRMCGGIFRTCWSLDVWREEWKNPKNQKEGKETRKRPGNSGLDHPDPRQSHLKAEET